jgi:hypothetical protein
MPEWKLHQAKTEFVGGVQLVARQVVSSATDNQKAQFAAELPALLDHLKEFCDPINLRTGRR